MEEPYGEVFSHVRPVVVASHPRSGTHLAIDLLRRQFGPLQSWKRRGEGNDRLYVTLDLLGGSGGTGQQRKAARVVARTERPIFKTHYHAGFSRGFFADQSDRLPGDWLDLIDRQAKIVYVVRDGRDALRSLWKFMQGFDPLARCSFGRFIRQEERGASRVRLWAEHVENWLAVPGVLAVRYEDLLSDPRGSLARIGDHLGLVPLGREPLLPAPLRSRWQGRLERLFCRRPESTAILGRGGSGGSEKALATNDLALFATEAGGTLARLGYTIWPIPSNKAA